MLLLNVNSPLPLSRPERDLETEVEALAAELAESKRQVHVVVAQAKQAASNGGKTPLTRTPQGHMHQARDMMKKTTEEVHAVMLLQDELQERLKLATQ